MSHVVNCTFLRRSHMPVSSAVPELNSAICEIPPAQWIVLGIVGTNCSRSLIIVDCSHRIVVRLVMYNAGECVDQTGFSCTRWTVHN